jgi:parvulin-like peptidyl-prolyl isomerase
VQRGKDLSISVDPEVTRRIADIQVKSGISDADKFHEYIREGSGLSFEDFKQQMHNQLLTQKVIGQEVSRNVTVSKAEIEKYYNEHKSEFVRQEMVFLREILISTGDKSPAAVAAAEKKAKDILARARKGEKFSDLARSFSDAETTAKNDGELGAFKKGDLLKPIEDVVFKQSKGYITDPIRTDNGFEILKVEERYAAGQAALSDVENEITEKLFLPRMEPKVREYLTKLREDAFIEIRGGFVDSGAAPGKDTSWKDPAQLKPETTTKEEVAAHKKKKFLGVIPHGTTKVQAAPPTTKPESATPPPPSTIPPSSAPTVPPK